jgi:DNA-binding NarL/FixJ family response regulator
VLRLVVADGSFIVREAVSAVLRDAPDLDVQATVSDHESLMAAVEEAHPQVVVTDVHLPPGWSAEGIRAAAALRASRPDVGVVILTDEVEPAFVLELFRAGSERRAYLLKDEVHDRDAIVGAVHAVARGRSVIDPKVVERVVAARSRPGSEPLEELSPREHEILGQVATGKTNGAIAKDLRLSKRSVEKHVHTIFIKLGLADSEDVSPRVKAALIFLGHRSTTAGSLHEKR